MVKKIANSITFITLVSLLLLNGTAREFIHEFAHHHDTVDHIHWNYHTDNHAAFEPEHHHCDFLNYLTPVYHPIEEDLQVYLLKKKVFIASFDLQNLFSKEREHTALRGPPLC